MQILRINKCPAGNTSIFSALCIDNNFLPRSLNTETVDPDIKANILLANQYQVVNKVLTNSFGFGGSNCSLVLGVNQPGDVL